MVHKLSRALVLLPIVILAAPQQAVNVPQTSKDQEPIKVQVQEVIVPVTVTTAKGEFVTGMVQSDFTILEQGKPQTITSFSGVPNQPVVVGFLLDLSSASRTQWKNISDAVIELVFTLIPGDKTHAGYLVGYGNEAELLVDTTFDPEKIVEKIRKLSPSGGSAMNDAVYMAASNKNRKLVAGEPRDPRRVIVVIGDGHDNSSTHSFEEGLELAQRQEITVFCISTEAYGFGNPSRKYLDQLAADTGGRVEEPLQNVYKDVSGFLTQPSDFGNYQLKVGTGAYAAQIAKTLDHSVANVAGEITTQYTLHYIPTVDGTPDPRLKRTIEVKVQIPNVTVRARPFYYPYQIIP